MIAPYFGPARTLERKAALCSDSESHAGTQDRATVVAVITIAACRLDNDNVFAAYDAYQFLLFLRSRSSDRRCLLKLRPSRPEG